MLYCHTDCLLAYISLTVLELVGQGLVVDYICEVFPQLIVIVFKHPLLRLHQRHARPHLIDAHSYTGQNVAVGGQAGDGRIVREKSAGVGTSLYWVRQQEREVPPVVDRDNFLPS